MKMKIGLYVMITILISASMVACTIFNITKLNPDTETIEVDQSKLERKEPNYENNFISMYLPDGWEEDSIEKESDPKRITISFSHAQSRPRKGNMFVDINVDYCNKVNGAELVQQDLIDEFIKKMPSAKRLSDYEIDGITFSRFKQYDLDEKKYKWPVIHVGIVGDDKYWISVIFDMLNRDKLIDDYYTLDFRNIIDSLVLKDLDWDEVKDTVEERDTEY